jgi:hypothetical protein
MRFMDFLQRCKKREIVARCNEPLLSSQVLGDSLSRYAIRRLIYQRPDTEGVSPSRR